VSTVSDDQGLVLVIGGAEREGAAAVGHLRARGLPVRALLRTGEDAAAERLYAAGASPVFADPEDLASVERALEGVASLVLSIDEADSGPRARLHEGRVVADAASRAPDLAELVYIAGSGTEHHQVSCDRSKEIEERMRELGLPLTVLRPVTLMEEIPWYWLHRYDSGLELATPYEPDLPLPLVAADDVGALAALAVADPQLFAGRAHVTIAGDEATPRSIADELARDLDEPVRLTEVQVEGVFMYPDAVGHARDLEWLRSVYPQIQTLRQWLTVCGSDVCRSMVGLAPGGPIRG
jgi:uncharacterized protein YbjT (DUF2867 family)